MSVDGAQGADARIAELRATHANERHAMQLRIDTLTESTRGLEQQLAELTSTLAARSAATSGSDLVELEQLRVLVGQLENQIVTLKQPQQQSQRRQQSMTSGAMPTPTTTSDESALAEWKHKCATLERAVATATADLQTQANRAAELEAMCSAERTRRLKVQAKLKDVLLRTGAAGAGASQNENAVNN